MKKKERERENRQSKRTDRRTSFITNENEYRSIWFFSRSLRSIFHGNDLLGVSSINVPTRY